MSVAGLLNATCSIVRPTRAQDSVTREWVDTALTAGTGVRCRVQVQSAFKRSEPAPTGVTMFDVYFLASESTPPVIGDRLTSVTGYTNAHFEVKSNPLDDCGVGPYIRVECQYVKGEVQ